MKTDNSQYYGSVTRLLHWLMAACFFFMFATAIAWNLNGDLKFLMGPHKAVGFVLMVLAVLRFIWMLRQKERPANAWIAKAGHLALYALMLIVPALAIARQIGRGQQNQTLIDLGNNWHGELGWVFLVLIIGHIGMAGGARGPHAERGRPSSLSPVASCPTCVLGGKNLGAGKTCAQRGPLEYGGR